MSYKWFEAANGLTLLGKRALGLKPLDFSLTLLLTCSMMLSNREGALEALQGHSQLSATMVLLLKIL